MGFRINTNLSSLRSRRVANQRTDGLRDSYRRLGSGQRLTTDDASGVGRASRASVEARSLTEIVRATRSGIDQASRADGRLSEIGDNLSRLRELAVIGSNGTLSASDRASLNAEFGALVEEIDRTSRGDGGEEGISLEGGEPIEVQTGTRAGDTLEGPEIDVSAEGLGLDGVDLSDAAAANAALNRVHSAIDTVRSARGDVSSFSRSLTQSRAAATRAQQSHLTTANRITSLDVALASSELVRHRLLTSAPLATLLQANTSPSQALRLLG